MRHARIAMQPAVNDLLERIGDAADIDALERACLQVDGLPGTDANRSGLAAAMHRHLLRRSPHPNYRRWIDSYFGLRREAYRSPLQQPNYIYYPALDPTPWFRADQVPGLAALRPSIPAVATELDALLREGVDLSPYVGAEAAVDPRWTPLASNPAWSSLHLVRGGRRDRARLDALPATRAFLDAAPLSECPPHAPECFVSRLMPGVRLPPHFGVSNIKLTVHLPIALPAEGCSITVAGIERTWQAGEFLVFDDSFEHSARNLSQEGRTVLIFDVWHPGLVAEERAAIAYAVRALDFGHAMLLRLG
jgi:hypothetical protein